MRMVQGQHLHHPSSSQATLVPEERAELIRMVMMFAVAFVVNHRFRPPRFVFGVSRTNEEGVTFTPGETVTPFFPAPMVATPLTLSNRTRPLPRMATPVALRAEA